MSYSTIASINQHFLRFILQYVFYIKEISMIKTRIALPCFLILLTPGCFWKKNVKSEPEGTIKIEQGKKQDKSKQAGRKSLFLDDSVQDFVFEEEAGTNVFSSDVMKDTSKIHLIDAPDAREWEERRAQQSKYGLKSVYFGFDQFSIQSDQEAALKHNLTVLKKLPSSTNIVIEGHACRFAGSREYNMFLSEKRAQAVARWLVKHGISIDRIKAVGRGFEMCIVSAGTKEQQAPNRRVEIFVENNN
jgi:outer membrane protein OmpA-like peptidoglycan-associated protein